MKKKEPRPLGTVDVNAFIQDVLKLGTKDNLFDKYMKREGIDPAYLSTLIRLVANRLSDKYSITKNNSHGE
jgi:hypothetical protein